ncbi:MAG: PaaI family thioesterase [Candidatus Palauibacterales bacterium]|nr:PaaI family thioesterase [Candidatus Palauibacterales bacterium]
MTETTHERVGRLLRELPGSERFEIPPPVFEALGGEFVEFEPGRSLTAEWPVSDLHRGPSGRLQGGILAAYFDNTVGPLAFLTGRDFYVSVDLSTEFLRPVRPEDDTVVVEAEVLGETSRLLFIQGECRRPDGTVLALCRTKLIAVDEEAPEPS